MTMSQDPAEIMKIQKPLAAFFPSHDRRSMHPTIATVYLVATILNRPLLSTPNGGLGQAVALNGMIRGFDQRITYMGIRDKMVDARGCVRALWIEDDIEVSPGLAPEIAKMILTADEHGWNIVTPYCTGFRNSGEFNWVYFKMPNEATGEIGRPFTEEEIQELKPFDELDGLAGLGFYYGDINLNYTWYEGTFNGHDRFGLPSYSGIDWNYFLDNKVKLRHYPIELTHEKPVMFMNLRVIKNWGNGSLENPIERIRIETDPNDPYVGVVTTNYEKQQAAIRKEKFKVS